MLTSTILLSVYRVIFSVINPSGQSIQSVDVTNTFPSFSNLQVQYINKKESSSSSNLIIEPASPPEALFITNFDFIFLKNYITIF